LNENRGIKLQSIKVQSFVWYSPLKCLIAMIFLGMTWVSEASPRRLLITDVDDTVKVSNVRDKLDLAWRWAFDPRAFTGMSELYRVWLKPNGSEFHVVSGTPRLLEWSVEDFLEDFDFPAYHSIQTRPISTWDELLLASMLPGLSELYSTRTFKEAALGNVIRQRQVSQDDVVVLIGDDTESDPEAYATWPNPTVIYIRQVEGRAIPNEQIGVSSALEIAAWEFRAGRISAADFEVVLNEIEKEGDAANLFLPDQHCPSGHFLFPELPLHIEQRARRAQVELARVCEALSNQPRLR
jgi:phosphatidate phosphatase APP1